jgi:hypothetical protein
MAYIAVPIQLVIVVVVVPLNVTVPVPCVEPKAVPAIFIDAPTAPEAGDRLVMFGAATTENDLPPLACPLTVTTTSPVVSPVGTVATIELAPQLVIVAVIPWNVAVLVPWVEPKFVPVIVTEAPTAPMSTSTRADIARIRDIGRLWREICRGCESPGLVRPLRCSSSNPCL